MKSRVSFDSWRWGIVMDQGNPKDEGGPLTGATALNAEGILGAGNRV